MTLNIDSFCCSSSQSAGGVKCCVARLSLRGCFEICRLPTCRNHGKNGAKNTSDGCKCTGTPSMGATTGRTTLKVLEILCAIFSRSLKPIADQWIFFDWLPIEGSPHSPPPPPPSPPPIFPPLSHGEGEKLVGTFPHKSSRHYELLDPSKSLCTFEMGCLD